jgi:hypothetical protein
MCEIFLLWTLGRQVADKARRKGHTPTGYVILLVVLWIVGEIGGGVMGGIIAAVSSRGNFNQEPSMVMVYGLAILGAAMGAGLAFGIVALLPDYGGVQRVGRFNNYYDDRHDRQYDERYDNRRDEHYDDRYGRSADRPASREDGFTRREERWEKGDKWDKGEKWD